ncbi:MAG: helix-turn-helix domain-containing protein [Gammaproteobacteria bacterium]|nr:helix-turn-helix domain-containing protein [Gammaproteobacteria bacterium]
MSTKPPTGTQIRRLRTRKGWTQARLADLIGVTHVTVSNWERGVFAPNPMAARAIRALIQTA